MYDVSYRGLINSSFGDVLKLVLIYTVEHGISAFFFFIIVFLVTAVNTLCAQTHNRTNENIAVFHFTFVDTSLCLYLCSCYVFIC